MNETRSTPQKVDVAVQTDPVSMFEPLTDLMDEFWKLPTGPDLERIIPLIINRKPVQSPYILLPVEDLDRYISPQENNETMYDRYMHLRQSIITWSGQWGGPALLSDTIDVLYYRAMKGGNRKMVKLIEQLWVYEAHGKLLLREVQVLEGGLPHSALAIASIWMHQQELVITLTQCLTIVQTKLQIMRRSAVDQLDGMRGIPECMLNIVAEDMLRSKENLKAVRNRQSKDDLTLEEA